MVLKRLWRRRWRTWRVTAGRGADVAMMRPGSKPKVTKVVVKVTNKGVGMAPMAVARAAEAVGKLTREGEVLS